MRTRPTYLNIYIAAFFAAMFFSACENDLKKVQEIAAADATKPIQRTTDVDLIFSDSAKVKFRVTAPLLIEYATKKPYKELPKSVKIVFYNADMQEDGNIIADTAYMRNEDKLIEFRRNVVATNKEGSVYKSDELFYDMTTNEVYSRKKVVMTKVDGDVMTGTSFKSTDGLNHPVFQNATAIIHVNGEEL